jgi:hypothetical protein
MHAVCRYAECHYSKFHYAEFHVIYCYAERHGAECCGTFSRALQHRRLLKPGTSAIKTPWIRNVWTP